MGRFLAFGEVMLRLSPPGRELLMQSPRLDVWVAGAEANVATQLARLGHDVGLATRVPDNDLGRAAITTLRGHGVDVSQVQTGGERMGLYFVTAGAGLRATEVIYDRAHSAFAEAPVSAWDWDRMLAGVDRLHLSGITPALGPVPAESAITAAAAARERGIAVSFDGNWRGKLWERWDSDPRAILRRIVEQADLMFGNHRDIALLLGRDDFGGEGEDRRRAAAEAAFEAFPNLQTIASTARHVEHVDLHRLSARVDAREGHAQTAEVEVAGIVDRIGGGDAFAAGVLHGLRRGGDIGQAAATGLALAVLKHSLPGDAGLFRQPDLDAYLAGGLDVRR
ncbi:sugar kinase [Sphingomonas carotinifaciens]|uniref:2-dehydro-3-deoxygluconokinase n=1 Tax=Sphingomonas carotinifaciens TaxID=1166323 RepID=A0A1G7QGJ7_9SPHN|nr:sugar kinase [Sphingomonas carotinifaciens]MBB4087728.1 2-dehydro-3-deoxygluconokinase [Sphingomonas carotinifaciens]MWC44907.1 sugar kinase [Sphingomonas carotinifaciens]SDF96740.1 2-dehydro-3-deoxygluconokinase [Sphingomonas carotinifaciens]